MASLLQPIEINSFKFDSKSLNFEFYFRRFETEI